MWNVLLIREKERKRKAGRVGQTLKPGQNNGSVKICWDTRNTAENRDGLDLVTLPFNNNDGVMAMLLETAIMVLSKRNRKA